MTIDTSSPLSSIQRSQSSQPFESLHTLSWYKQISSRTISGPVCQPGSCACHQWSDNCCVILRPCDLQVSLPPTGSLSRPRLWNNKLCLPRLNLYLDKNMRMTCLLWPWHSQATAKEGIAVKSHLKDGVREAGSDYSSLFHAGLLFFFVLSSVSLICCWNNSWGPSKSSHQYQPSQWPNH